MSAEPSSVADLTAQLRTPTPLEVTLTGMHRGLDNYHVDVQLSNAFALHVATVAEEQVSRIVSGKRLLTGNSEPLDDLRAKYLDLMTATLHRCKTDLSPQKLLVLQFAPVKFVLHQVREKLGAVVTRLEETLAQQQYSGSRSLLTTQEQFAHFRRHRNEYQYRICRVLFRQLHRVEVNQLRELREQYLGHVLRESVNVLFNPMLSAARPDEPALLMDTYAIWAGGAEGFGKATGAIEGIARGAVAGQQTPALRQEEDGESEIYDEFGGLFASQAMLGRAVDQHDIVTEALSWLELPGNLEVLFDQAAHEEMADRVKEAAGYRQWWALRGELKKLAKLGESLCAELSEAGTLRRVAAGRLMRERWSIGMSQLLDIEDAAAYAAGADRKKIAAKVDKGLDGAQKLLDFLEELADTAEAQGDADEEELTLALLTDYSRYRLHLKYFRFAHRMFNRITVRTDPEEIASLQSAGSLYQMFGVDETLAGASEEPQIVHHTIVKADVRGSTTVTNELLAQGLNPASYFSERFFGPITALLEDYGAQKVFIEGDAVILSLYEHDLYPEQWFGVSRACGIARAMLEIVNAKNAHSRQMKLPLLEIGIGIAYLDERPLFLRDESNPIMISPAIGDADRLSSCSWRLRELVEGSSFDVEVYEIHVEDQCRGEKGQSFARYNVGGILLDKSAYRKLMSEITMKKLTVRINDKPETLLVGKYPDTKGKERELVIREGRVGLLRGDAIEVNEASEDVFHEVVMNPKIVSHVLDQMRKSA